MPTNPIITNSIERMLGFEKYTKIMIDVNKVDVSKNQRFQKLFDDYYEIRRNAAWRKIYYDFFQKAKSDSSITFDDIIDYLYDKAKTNKGLPHPVEASFSSKMFATINHNMPILDSQVLANMGLSIVGKTPADKLKSAKDTYETIRNRYSNYLGTADCLDAIALFDTYFPDYTTVSEVKKIDWFLWGFSKSELNAIGKFGSLL